MKSLTITLLLAVISIQQLQAQKAASKKPVDTIAAKQPDRLNSVYVELLGATVFGATLNYQRFIFGPSGLSAHVGGGYGYFSLMGAGGSYVFIPLGISYYIPFTPNNRNLIELGGTDTFVFGYQDHARDQFVSGNISWRHNSRSGKSYFKINFLPFIKNNGPAFNINIPWFGFSIGRNF